MKKRLGGVRALLACLIVLALTPSAAFAQASAPAIPSQGAASSPSPAQAPGAAQPPPAASAGASAAASAAAVTESAAAAPASPAASGPPVRALPTPVGANPSPPTAEPLSWFAYLLIVLAVVWFLASIGGIIRLLTRPARGTYAAPLPEPEQDRPFLSFIMPLGAIVTVGIIISVWGLLFLWLSHISPRVFDTEVYPFIVDLFVVTFVMFIATVMALRGGAQSHSEVE